MKSPYQTYKDFARQGQLAYQVGSDGRPVFYPRIAVLETGAAPEWRISRGVGRVYASTVIHERDGSRRSLALIDLDEGFRMMSRVEDIAPEKVNIGMKVRVIFRESEDGEAPLAVFIPDEEVVYA